MKYLKITLAVATLLTFSQTYAQEIDVKIEKRFVKADTNGDKAISLENELNDAKRKLKEIELTNKKKNLMN